MLLLLLTVWKSGLGRLESDGLPQRRHLEEETDVTDVNEAFPVDAAVSDGQSLTHRSISESRGRNIFVIVVDEEPLENVRSSDIAVPSFPPTTPSPPPPPPPPPPPDSFSFSSPYTRVVVFLSDTDGLLPHFRFESDLFTVGVKCAIQGVVPGASGAAAHDSGNCAISVNGVKLAAQTEAPD